MLGTDCDSPCNHSLKPSTLPNPKRTGNTGLRKSPSKRSTLCRFFRASMTARLAQIMLLPSSGIVLVISTFLKARSCCNWRKRTPKKRNFSAARLSVSVRLSGLLFGSGVIFSDGKCSKSASVSSGVEGNASRSAARKSSAGITDACPLGDRSASDFCSASNIWLMLDGSRCQGKFFQIVRLRSLQILLQLQQGFNRRQRLVFLVLGEVFSLHDRMHNV